LPGRAPPTYLPDLIEAFIQTIRAVGDVKASVDILANFLKLLSTGAPVEPEEFSREICQEALTFYFGRVIILIER